MIRLTFTSTSIAGKKMIVQATNTGSDVSEGQFDLVIPGGGVGIFNACTAQYGAPPDGWGAQYGGISTDTCSTFPSALQDGCSFRFGDFFEGADNPEVDWKQVTCPKALTDKTGCVRAGETPTGSGSQGSGSGSENKPATSAATSAVSSAASSAAAAVSSAPAESSPAESTPSAETTNYGTTAAAGVSYSSAAAPSSSSTLVNPVGSSLPPSGGLPPYGTGAGPTGPLPTGDDGQCAIEYVYVDAPM